MKDTIRAIVSNVRGANGKPKDSVDQDTNRDRHGVSFETAQLVFNDPHALIVQDRHECGEERWQTWV